MLRLILVPMLCVGTIPRLVRTPETCNQEGLQLVPMLCVGTPIWLQRRSIVTRRICNSLQCSASFSFQCSALERSPDWLERQRLVTRRVCNSFQCSALERSQLVTTPEHCNQEGLQLVPMLCVGTVKSGTMPEHCNQEDLSPQLKTLLWNWLYSPKENLRGII